MASTSSATDRIGGLLGSIPGYRGYRDKEERRDADRRVRERVAAAYAAQADRVERVARDLANQRRLKDVGPVNEFAQAIRHKLVLEISDAGPASPIVKIAANAPATPLPARPPTGAGRGGADKCGYDGRRQRFRFGNF